MNQFSNISTFFLSKILFLRNISKFFMFYISFRGFRKIILKLSILHFLSRKIQLILLFSWEIYQKSSYRSRRSIGTGLKTLQNFEEYRLQLVEKLKIIKRWIIVFIVQRMFSKLHARFWSLLQKINKVFEILNKLLWLFLKVHF